MMKLHSTSQLKNHHHKCRVTSTFNPHFFEGEQDTMQDSEIIDKVLMHLQGYIVESDTEETISQEETETESETESVINDLQSTSTSSSEVVSDLQYDKKVSSEEILSFINLTKNYVLSYINQSTLPTIKKIVDDTEVEVTDPIVCDALFMWTAGKIWQKYNVRVNNNEDDTTPFGYGDKLVIQAKEMLKPFKYYNMMVY